MGLSDKKGTCTWALGSTCCLGLHRLSLFVPCERHFHVGRELDSLWAQWDRNWTPLQDAYATCSFGLRSLPFNCYQKEKACKVMLLIPLKIIVGNVR